MIHARHQYQPFREYLFPALAAIAKGRQDWLTRRKKYRGTGKHKRVIHFSTPRPKPGTFIGNSLMVYGPDPWPMQGPADLARPLKQRRPDLFNGTWRNANQRGRAILAALAKAFAKP